MTVARVFPRKTSHSPDDDMAFFGLPPFWAKADEVHISVTFDYDIPKAEKLLYPQWKHIAPTKIGGVAYHSIPDEFTPGLYLKKGITITSRGCPNRCKFCSAWKESRFKELEIKDGHVIQDNNLLACSDDHIKKVFAMLARQKTRPVFSGGLEAARLKQWHVNEFVKLKPSQMFFAYDEPLDYEPLVQASKMLHGAGFNRNQMRCYVLIGFDDQDTIQCAENRLMQALALGFFPLAMLYKKDGKPKQWKDLQRKWARPAIISSIKVAA